MIAIKHTSIQPDPGQGQPGAKPEPLATGITATLKSDLSKLGPEKAGRVMDVVKRKD